MENEIETNITNNDLNLVSTYENNQGYTKDILVDRTKIMKADLTLSKKANFITDKKTIATKFRELINPELKRKNLIHFGLMEGEVFAPTEQTQSIIIPIIRSNQIRQQLRSMPLNQAEKMTTVFVSSIQLLFKSTFQPGEDTPLRLRIRDDRYVRGGTIVSASGNLSETKIMFQINLRASRAIKDKDLDRSLTLWYDFERHDLLRPGNHPFSITFRVNYALASSHHSLTFINKDFIEIEELFKPLLNLDEESGLSAIARPNNEILMIDDDRSYKPRKSVLANTLEPPMALGKGKTKATTSDDSEAKQLRRVITGLTRNLGIN